MRTAIFGGSFNPIHYGHLLSAIAVLEQLHYDKILFIPANIPVHKDSSSFPDAIHRIRMVELAVKNREYCSCSDMEIRRGGKSYSIDSIREFSHYHSSGKPGLIIGDDLVSDLSSWKEIDCLVKEADLIGLKRKNSNPLSSPYPIKWIENRIIDISSTEIRDRVKNHKMIDFLLPNSVKEYIIKNNLYQ